MAIQPRWNKIEAAVLLEAVLNVENCLEKRQDAIVRVSATLRKMAETRGIKIDDKYRNINGITFQFQSMEYSALGRLSPTNKTGSKLFDEIVQLKNQFPNKYNALLKQAREFLKTDKTKSKDEVDKMKYREVFKEWLLSHGKNELATDYIIREFDAISDYAKDKKVSVFDMWEISNPKQYQKYIRALQEYKFFRVLQKEKYKFFKNNSKIYFTFLKDGITPVGMISSAPQIPESEFAVLDVDKKLYASFPNEVRNIYRILKLDSRHAYLTTKQISDLAKPPCL